MRPIPTPTERDLARFLAKVDQSAGPDCCWFWRAGKLRQGYGTFRVGSNVFLATRLAYVWLGGKELPLYLDVLHHCDTPPCVNPKCLFLGTNQDNVADRVAKGRSFSPEPLFGEANKMAKFSKEDVEHMFALRSQGKTQQQIADVFTTGQGTISRILNGVRRSQG